MKLVSLVFAVAACSGGSKPAPQQPVSAPTAEGHDHHQMSPALTKFHDVLSPRWHAPKGEQRMKDTCGAIADFTSGATEVGNKDLTDAVIALEASCKAND